NRSGRTIVLRQLAVEKVTIESQDRYRVVPESLGVYVSGMYQGQVRVPRANIAVPSGGAMEFLPRPLVQSLGLLHRIPQVPKNILVVAHGSPSQVLSFVHYLPHLLVVMQVDGSA